MDVQALRVYDAVMRAIGARDTCPHPDEVRSVTVVAHGEGVQVLIDREHDLPLAYKVRGRVHGL